MAFAPTFSETLGQKRIHTSNITRSVPPMLAGYLHRFLGVTEKPVVFPIFWAMVAWTKKPVDVIETGPLDIQFLTTFINSDL